MTQVPKIFITTALMFFQILFFAQSKKENFVGKWKAPKGAIIIISIFEDGFIGKTEKEDATVLKDVKLMKGKWEGVVLNPRENKIAKCELFLVDNRLKIIARKGMFHKTLYWTRQK